VRELALKKPTQPIEMNHVDAATMSYALWFAGILMQQDGFPEVQQIFDEARASFDSRFESAFGADYLQRIKDTGLFEVVKQELARRSPDPDRHRPPTA
jgi:hypothetical protein